MTEAFDALKVSLRGIKIRGREVATAIDSALKADPPNGRTVVFDYAEVNQTWFPRIAIGLAAEHGASKVQIIRLLDEPLFQEDLGRFAAGLGVELVGVERVEPTKPFAPTIQVDSSPLADITTKREILNMLKVGKYALPFDQGRFAFFSVFGTEDWQDYAALVLEMIHIDTLLNIEEKLDQLLARLANGELVSNLGESSGSSEGFSPPRDAAGDSEEGG